MNPSLTVQSAPVPAKARASRGNNMLAFAGVVMASLAAVVIGLKGSAIPGQAQREAQALRKFEFAERAEIRSYVEAQLRQHIPTATKFSPGSETVITRDPVPIRHVAAWHVAGWVDAPGRDGAIVRQRYTIRVQTGANGWRGDRLKLLP